MAVLAANTIYLKFDTTEVDAYFIKVSLTPSNATQDVTMGSGTSDMQRAAGLNDTKISIELGYDSANVQSFIQKLKAGTRVTIEYGPEGAVTGKPRHVQDFIMAGAPFDTNVNKQFTTFTVSADGAGAPSVDMFAGAVYP